MAPARRQNTAAGGIRADVTIISMTCENDREAPRKRLPHSNAVMTVQTAAPANNIGMLSIPMPTAQVASAATVA